MNMNNKLTIIGAGRRVQQDLIPVLTDLGYSQNNISIYAKSKRRIFVRNTFYEVSNINNLNRDSIEDFIYIAIPSKSVYKTLDKVFKINSEAKVIVDTPILSSEIVNNFSDKDICVAEDAAFLSKYLIKNKTLLLYNILYMDRSAYFYHGIAFIESILSEIFFHFSLFSFYFAFCKKGVAIIRGPNNYEKGNIYLNFKAIPFPNLSKSEVNLIGGLSNFDSVSFRFLDLKRLGLKLLVRDFFEDKGHLISLKIAYSHFSKSKMINIYIDTLKKVVKSLF